jgi:hypothetical protein
MLMFQLHVDDDDDVTPAPFVNDDDIDDEKNF